MEQEYISDIFGERAILLGGIHGLVEYMFRDFNLNYNEDYSYNASVTYIVDTLSKKISSDGLLDIYLNLTVDKKLIFSEYYTKAYTISKPLFREIYNEVKSGNEIRSIMLNGNTEMTDISSSRMWKIPDKHSFRKSNRLMYNDEIKSSGLYIGCIMAQVDILMENNHNNSEIINESIIEAVDSLNPYMLDKGISHMIDNCSTTARLGARKWAPRLDYLLEQNMCKSYNEYNYDYINKFVEHPIHSMFNQIRNINLNNKT